MRGVSKVGATTTFDSGKEFLNDVLKDINAGNIQLPDFQRDWVWDDDHVKSLLASVSLSYPIGAVMMLETGNSEMHLMPRPIEGVHLEKEKEPERLILDGQQRLTSLFLSLYSGEPVRTWKIQKKNEMKRWYYIDIEKAMNPNNDRDDVILSIPEEKTIKNFRGEVIEDYSSMDAEFKAGIFPLSKVFNYIDWMQAYLKYWNFDQEKSSKSFKFHEEIVKRFEQYQLPIITLKKETPKAAVCQVFEKVNTGGVSLNVFELLTAMFAVDNKFMLRDHWEAVQKQMHKHRVLKSVENTDFLQAIMLLTTFERKQANKDVPVTCKREDILKLTRQEYEINEPRITKGFEDVAKLLYLQKIFKPDDLPYRSQLVAFAAIMAVLGEKSENDGVKSKLFKWYWCGVFGELYGSAIESRMAKDMFEVVQWIYGGPEPSTVQEANFVPNRLLTMKTRNSAAYKGISAIIMREGGYDFRSGTPIDEHAYFDEKVDIHHIFPRDYCKSKKINVSLCDSIINKTPLSAKTNRIIGGKAPSIYLASLEHRAEITPERMNQILSSHLIDSLAIHSDDFETYFNARKEALLQHIETAMGKTITRDSTQLMLDDLQNYTTVEDEESNGEEVYLNT